MDCFRSTFSMNDGCWSLNHSMIALSTVASFWNESSKESWTHGGRCYIAKPSVIFWYIRVIGKNRLSSPTDGSRLGLYIMVLDRIHISSHATTLWSLVLSFVQLHWLFDWSLYFYHVDAWSWALYLYIICPLSVDTDTDTDVFEEDGLMTRTYGLASITHCIHHVHGSPFLSCDWPNHR